MFLTTEPLEGYFEGTNHTQEQVVTHDFGMCVGAVGVSHHRLPLFLPGTPSRTWENGQASQPPTA